MQSELDRRALYEVRTHTAPDQGAATSARVYLEAWGRAEVKGGPSTGEARLLDADAAAAPFQRGATDTFEVCIELSACQAGAHCLYHAGCIGCLAPAGSHTHPTRIT